MPTKNVDKTTGEVLTPEVVDLVNRLSKSERTELARQEKRIDKALPSFVEIGEALNLIRDNKLYRGTHGTFDGYLSERWGFTRQRAAQIIGAAETMAALPVSVRPAVTTERAARALKPVAKKPAAAKRAVKKATETATGATPTAGDFERAVQGEVGGGSDAIPHTAPAPPPTPSEASTTVDDAKDWLRLTDQLNLAALPEPSRRKIRAVAVGLVEAIDVSLGESQKARHVAAAKKRAPTKPSNGTRTVEPRFKAGKS